MAKRNKKSTVAPQKFSPTKYIRTKARSFPIHQCLLSTDYKEGGIAQIIVVRQQPSGKFLCGVYMVDIFCLGLKNTLYQLNLNDDELVDFLDKFPGNFDICEYVRAHNIIYGAIGYAEDIGFSPDSDFKTTRFILEEDDEDVELLDLEFGRNGKPFFISGPYDDIARVKRILDKNVGHGNWDFMVGGPG